MKTKRNVYIKHKYEIIFDGEYCDEDCELFGSFAKGCTEYSGLKQMPDYKCKECDGPVTGKFKRAPECMEKYK